MPYFLSCSMNMAGDWEENAGDWEENAGTWEEKVK